MTLGVVQIARSGSEADFLAAYDPTQANAVDPMGRTVLMAALGNRDPAARVAIAMRLLDDGADPTAVTPSGSTVLHVLFTQPRHDPAAEAPLLRRLVDGGADLNAAMGKFGTPLQCLMGLFDYRDEQLAPLYDVIFDRDELRLLEPAAYRSTALQAARRLLPRRAILVARMEDYLRAHDIDVPQEQT